MELESESGRFGQFMDLGDELFAMLAFVKVTDALRVATPFVGSPIFFVDQLAQKMRGLAESGAVPGLHRAVHARRADNAPARHFPR